MNYNAALIGKRIRDQRKRLGLTQEALAEILDISSTYLGQIENGKRGVNLGNLIELASVLGVTLDYLVSDFLGDQLAQEAAAKERWQALLHGRSPEEVQLLTRLTEKIVETLFPEP